MAALRTSLAPSAFALHARQFQRFLALPVGIRHASSAPPPPKPRLLEKPERFNPPSHPSRLRSKHRSYGAPLAEAERRAQKTRSYPHMMPAEGTFTYWFLTNRKIHLWISIGVLVMLTGGVWIGDFLYSTPFMDLLPPNSMFFAHPLTFMGRYIEVYQMHSEHVTAQTAEMRRQKVEDVKRRSEFRKAHGLEDADESKFGGWTAKADDEVLGRTPATKEGGELPAALEASIAQDLAAATEVAAPVTIAAEETYVDFEGKTQPAQKKWFGIW